MWSKIHVVSTIGTIQSTSVVQDNGMRKENKNSSRKCSNISVRKFRNSLIFGCKSQRFRWMCCIQTNSIRYKINTVKFFLLFTLNFYFYTRYTIQSKIGTQQRNKTFVTLNDAQIFQVIYLIDIALRRQSWCIFMKRARRYGIQIDQISISHRCIYIAIACASIGQCSTNYTRLGFNVGIENPLFSCVRFAEAKKRINFHFNA